MQQEILEAAVAALRADASLMTALGGDATRVGPIVEDEERRIPSVRYQVISDTEEETMNPVLVQFDYWAQGLVAAMQIERRIRTALTGRTRKAWSLPGGGSISMWALYTDSRSMTDPTPGVVHRSLDFRFVPVRADLTTP